MQLSVELLPERGFDACTAGLLVAAAAHFRNDEKILQVQSRPTEEGGKVVEEKCETDRLVLEISNDRFGDLTTAKQRLPESIFRNDALIG